VHTYVQLALNDEAFWAKLATLTQIVRHIKYKINAGLCLFPSCNNSNTRHLLVPKLKVDVPLSNRPHKKSFLATNFQ